MSCDGVWSGLWSLTRIRLLGILGVGGKDDGRWVGLGRERRRGL